MFMYAMYVRVGMGNVIINSQHHPHLFLFFFAFLRLRGVGAARSISSRNVRRHGSHVRKWLYLEKFGGGARRPRYLTYLSPWAGRHRASSRT
ncbi:hypothetical protein F4776DRAFT_645639 [Hypoxylon sp. NC0597]|nr:hypothetical protein F4776DRAFT_645639 [Hypoxylon sp. NC0597]